MLVPDRLNCSPATCSTEEIGTWLPKLWPATVSDRRFLAGTYQMLTLKAAEEEKIGIAASN